MSGALKHKGGSVCALFYYYYYFFYCSDYIRGFIFIQFYDGFNKKAFTREHPRESVEEKFGEKVEPWTRWSSGFNGTDLLKEPIKLQHQCNSVRLMFRYYKS